MGCAASTQRQTTSFEPGFDEQSGQSKPANAGKQRGSPVNCPVKAEAQCVDESPVAEKSLVEKSPVERSPEKSPGVSSLAHRHSGSMPSRTVSFVPSPSSSHVGGRRFSHDRHCGSLESNTSRPNESPPSKFLQKSPSLSTSLNSASLSEYPVPLGKMNKARAMALTNRVRLLQWLDGEQYLPSVLTEFDRGGTHPGDDAAFAMSSEQSWDDPPEGRTMLQTERQLTFRSLAKNHLFQLKAEYRELHSFYSEDKK